MINHKNRYLIALPIILLCTFVNAIDYSNPECNWYCQQSCIRPSDPVVQQKLNALCNDFSQNKFGENLKKIYAYACSIPYRYDDETEAAKYGQQGDSHPGVDWWQLASETITEGKGDCEDHAILLATLIEALYNKTYGYVPSNLVYVVFGSVPGGGHMWTAINEAVLSGEASDALRSVSINLSKTDVLVGDVSAPGINLNLSIKSHDPNLLENKNSSGSVPLLSFIWNNEKWVELESTWNQPISQYAVKIYPFISVWTAFNDQRVDDTPQFITPAPQGDAEIVDVTKDNQFRVIVKNKNLGFFGANLRLVLYNSNDNQIKEETAYIFKYVLFGQSFNIHTYIWSNLINSENELLTLKLYNGQDLEDSKKFKLFDLIANSVTTSTTTTSSSTTTTSTSTSSSTSTTSTSEIVTTSSTTSTSHIITTTTSTTTSTTTTIQATTTTTSTTTTTTTSSTTTSSSTTSTSIPTEANFSIVRDLPTTARPNSSVNVRILMDINESDKPNVIGLTEYYPSGWNVSYVSINCTYKYSPDGLEWLFSNLSNPVQAYEISYTLNIPSNINGTYIFEGNADTGENIIETIGDTELKITGSCSIMGNYPPCETVSLSEVINMIQQWSNSEASLNDVINLINTWAMS